MNIMFLQGAGGTGKSSVLKHLQDQWPEQSKGGVYTLSSSTRASYAKLGIGSETASLQMDNETRVKLQLQVMEDWATDITMKVALIKQSDPNEHALLVVDRGPFDRMAYWLLTMMECQPGSVISFSECMDKMMGWLDDLSVRAVMYTEFPYPVPWSTQDQFRTTNELQTMALSLMISQMCFRYHLHSKTHARYWRLEEMLATSADPATRAQEIILRYANLVDNYLSIKPRKISFMERLTGR